MNKKKSSKSPAASRPIDNAALTQRIEELTRALQQERADALNSRQRYEEQMASIRKSVKVGVVAELLPVIDNFERALKHVPKELETHDYINGVKSVAKQFDQTLKNMGVERIATVGTVFDPHYHEAVSMEEGPGTQEIISDEIEPGYRIGEQVIRHARVKVKLQ